MPGIDTVTDLDNFYLDILGQQPRLHIYTQLCLCFLVADTSSHSAIVNTLTKGLERLSASFPWVAGQVVNEDAGERNTGIFKIKPLERIPRLVVKDLRHDPSIPTMDELRQANFPSRMLDESVIAPRQTIPSPEESVSVTPVFLLQANFITGGLLLTFLSQHQTMDMTGHGQVMDLLSKACRNEPFTSKELSTGNLVRRNLTPILDESYKQGSEIDSRIVKAISSQPDSNETINHPGPPPPPPKTTWASFSCDPVSLAALKSIATETITLPSGYISTDDALSAFIWQSIARARIPRLDPTAVVKLARAVDTRRFLGIPLTYPGCVVNKTSHAYPLQELVEEPLGGIASNLRAALDPQTSTLGYRSRALATFLDRAPDKSNISFSATLDSSADVTLSSWATVDSYELDFNLGLGKPEAVRRPQFIPLESLVYLMPRRTDGEITIMICLRDEDMERLRADEEFAKYAKYVG